MKRKIIAALSTLSVAIPLALFAAPSANAHYDDVSVGWSGMWVKNNYSGQPDERFNAKITLNKNANKINSIVNKGRYSIARYYDKADHTGVSIYLNNPARGGQWRDPKLSNGTDTTIDSWANRISSAKFI